MNADGSGSARQETDEHASRDRLVSFLVSNSTARSSRSRAAADELGHLGHDADVRAPPRDENPARRPSRPGHQTDRRSRSGRRVRRENGDLHDDDANGSGLFNVTSSASVSEGEPDWSPDSSETRFRTRRVEAATRAAHDQRRRDGTRSLSLPATCHYPVMAEVVANPSSSCRSSATTRSTSCFSSEARPRRSCPTRRSTPTPSCLGAELTQPVGSGGGDHANVCSVGEDTASHSVGPPREVAPTVKAEHPNREPSVRPRQCMGIRAVRRGAHRAQGG